MTVTNLLNTKWKFKDALSTVTITITLDFTSDQAKYTRLTYATGGGGGGGSTTTILKYDTTQVYTSTSNAWVKENYKTIEITGGKDLTNTTWINWLESNAVQIVQTPEEQFNEDMTLLVDSINTKSNTTTQKTIKEMKTAVDNIPLPKEEEVKDVILDFSTANPQVVNHSTDKVLSKVNINKPSTLLAENIKKDVNIAGVVGTLPNVINVASEAELPPDSPDGTIAIVGE